MSFAARFTALKTWKPAERVRGRGWFLLAALLALFAAFYWFTTSELLRQINPNRQASDQQANIEQARDSIPDVFPRTTNGVINPLWPWVAKTALDTRVDDEAFFIAGKRLNVALTGVFLVALALGCARFMPLLPAMNLMLVAALGCFIQRAVYFQPEPLFYMLFFGSWLACWALLVANPLWLYAVAGAVTALAWLAKGSTDPLLLVFLGASLLRWMAAVRPHWLGLSHGGAGRWSWRRHILGLLIFAAVYGAIIAPRAQMAAARFGDPLHSYTKYWMWMDDWWEEADPFMKKYDGVHFKQLPKEERPSFRRYRETHDWGEMGARLWQGTTHKLGRFFFPEKRLRTRYFTSVKPKGMPRVWKQFLTHRGLFPAAFLALTLGLALAAAVGRRASLREHPEIITVAVYALGAFTLYALAYGWYGPIGRGDRFMLSLFLPMTFTCVWIGERLRRFIDRPSAHWVFIGAHAAIFVMLVIQMVNLVLHPKFGA